MAVGLMDSQQLYPALMQPHVAPFPASHPGSLPPLPRPPRQHGKKFKRYNRGQQGGAAGARRHGQESYSAVPSLEVLRRDNKRKTRKHFRQNGRDINRSYPRSVPRAPDNTNSYLMRGPGISPTSNSFLVSPGNGVRQFHTNTPNPFQPGGTFKNSFGQLMGIGQELTELSANGGINLFGTNEGLITRVAQNDDDSSDFSDSDPEDGFELHVEDLSTSNEPVPAHARARLEEQAAIIADLQEQNMTLKERISLLQQELRELRGQSDAAGAHSADEDDQDAQPTAHMSDPEPLAADASPPAQANAPGSPVLHQSPARQSSPPRLEQPAALLAS